MKLPLMPLLAIIAIVFSIIPVRAQSTTEFVPVNLSLSGSTNSPTFIVDEEENIHVIWLDDLEGILHTTYNGETWSVPEEVLFPFDPYIPELVQNQVGRTHAFWIDEDGDLWSSSVSSVEFGSSDAWRTQQLLDNAVISFDVSVDDQGNMGLIYVKSIGSDEGPPGIYTKRFIAETSVWRQSLNLYQSRYVRAADPQTVHVDTMIVSGQEDTEIYAVWDDRPLKSLFFARSLDGGATWDTPMVIAGPQTLRSSTTPYNINIYANKSQLVLVFQNGQPGLSCTQIYLHSEDKGITWSDQKQMLGDLVGCATENAFLSFLDSTPFLWTYIQDEVYLSAWDGAFWSQPQNRSDLTTFEDPDVRILITLNNPQPKMVSGNEMYIVGSDHQRSDVWWNKLLLDEISGWFLTEGSWQPLEMVTSGTEQILSITLTADRTNQIHAFWSHVSEDLRETPASHIFYSRWENERLWSYPITVQSSEQEYSDQPSAVVDPSEQINLVWKAGANSEIYFSQAPSNLAVLNTSWSEPVLLSGIGQQAESPEIYVDEAGVLYVVYAVPINEQRGIYLTSSTDGGQTWSGPMKTSTSQDRRSSLVNHPHLRISKDGIFHLIWSDFELFSGKPLPVSVLYSQSLDSGATWSVPEVITNRPYLWSSLEITENGTIHRLWQEYEAGTLSVWHEYSTDSGSTWTQVRPVSLFGQKIGVPAVTKDSAGRLHLFQALNIGAEQYILQHGVWDGLSWMNQSAKRLDLNALVSLGSPKAIVSQAGELAVVFSVSVQDLIRNVDDQRLMFTHLVLGDLPESPVVPVTPLETRVLTSTPGGAVPATPTSIENTPGVPQTIQTSPPNLVDNPRRESNQSSGIIAGMVSAVLIIGIALGLHFKFRAGR